ncbi:hypothetical protein K4K58_001088 [Colletotrichum sp. SAR11_239]|nr:hypothetical protein K4K58_001088 [Colletotrichum sp. SAR11_239]
MRGPSSNVHLEMDDTYLPEVWYLALYSLNVYIVQVTYHTGGNIDVTADAVKSLSTDDVRILELGSKLEFISWYSYPGCISVNRAPSVININRWGFRELGVGLVTVTLPVLSPIFTRPFWRRGPYIRDYYDRLRNPRSPINNARFGNWLGTMVLRYIDEEEGAVFREPDSAKALEDAGYQEYAQRAGSARKSSNETYELETTSGGTSAKSITGIEPA